MIWDFWCFLVQVLVPSFLCGRVAASQLLMSACSTLFGEPRADLGFPSQSWPWTVLFQNCSTSLEEWGAFSFSASSDLGSLAVGILPENLQCLLAGLRASPAPGGSSSGVSAEGLSDPTVGRLCGAEALGRVLSPGWGERLEMVLLWSVNHPVPRFHCHSRFHCDFSPEVSRALRMACCTAGFMGACACRHNSQCVHLDARFRPSRPLPGSGVPCRECECGRSTWNACIWLSFVSLPPF